MTTEEAINIILRLSKLNREVEKAFDEAIEKIEQHYVPKS